MVAEFEELVSRADPPLARGPIHHDPNRNNILVDEVGNIKALLDFDESHVAYLVFDVAALIHYWADCQGAISAARIRDLVSAYQRVRPLSSSEVQVLATAVLVFYAAAAADFLSGGLRGPISPSGLQDCLSARAFRTLRDSTEWRDALQPEAQAG